LYLKKWKFQNPLHFKNDPALNGSRTNCGKSSLMIKQDNELGSDLTILTKMKGEK